ncbi:MAG: WD40 repeat domain-containing serine/threonine-protein kinase [Cyanobacteria bacterium P01_A01_bin.15]
MATGKQPNNGDRYKIIETLGQGRQGQTLLARPLAIDFPGAVVIKHSYYPQEPLDNLVKRLRTVGQHPQLPALIDGWQTDAGQFLAFEQITAPSIEADFSPWSPAALEPWLLSLLSVLEYLHSFRLVHGDIRPANIRQGPQPILVDLSVAPPLARQEIARSATGGDAAYAAPEQILGTLVYASDLYSLGLVAVRLLTGLAPFDLYSVADNRWIWPDLVADLPKNLTTVLHKLLERPLDSRYVCANQATTDLQKSPSLFLWDQARSLLPAMGKNQPGLPAPRAAEPIRWQSCYRLTDKGITTALALQGKRLAMGNSTGGIFVFDLAAGKDVYVFNNRRRGHRDRINALIFYGHLLCSASNDGTVRLWNLNSGKLTHSLTRLGWQPTDLAIAPPYLIISNGTGQITLWDLEQLTLCHTFSQHQDWISGIATSANGQRLASISRDRTLRLWSLPDQQLLETLASQSQAMAFHPSGNHVIVGNNQGQIDVWHIGTPTTQDRLCSTGDGVSALELSPDARLLAVGTEGNTLKVYQGADGQCVSDLPQGWGVIAIAFDGHTLVSSSQDETVTVWRQAPMP